MTALSINRKNTKAYNLTITENDEVKDITGYTVKFTVKKNTNDLDNDDVGAIISKTVTTHTDPSQGLTLISLTTSDTNVNPSTYFYDIKLRDPTGAWVKSTNADKFIVNGVVTNG
jgi:hypothetical protein